MYTMVLMAALTTGIDMPDRGGRRGGGCCGCYGGMGYGGCYGGMGMGYGGCYGGMGRGYGGCYGGMGMGWGGCYGGMGMGYGGYRMGYGGGWGGGYGGGYGGYTLGNFAPGFGNYAFSPMMSTWGWNAPLASGGAFLNQGTTQSFYYNSPTANEATIVVHVPANASLSIDGEQTQQRSNTRVFTSPPLEPGKSYTYTLRAEVDRNGRMVRETKTVEIRAGQRSEVTMRFDNANRGEDETSAPVPPDRSGAPRPTPRRLLDQ